MAAGLLDEGFNTCRPYFNISTVEQQWRKHTAVSKVK